MKTWRVAETFCPRCYEPLSAASAFNSDRPPVAGDHTVCAYCATVLTYVTASTLRQTTPEDRATWSDDERHDVARMQRAVVAALAVQTRSTTRH